MESQTPPPWTRHHVPDNPHGLTGVDHVALVAHDPIRAARLYVEVLGGTMCYATGFSDEERSQRRSPHSCVHVGGVLIQTGYPNDGKTFPDPHSKSYWPHLAFSATPAVLNRTCEQLRARRVPFSGPRSHLNVEAVSIYFLDPEGALLPAADALVVLNAHRGRAQVLTSWLDPEVVDEADPLAGDPDLDLFGPAGGRPTPAPLSPPTGPARRRATTGSRPGCERGMAARR